MSIIVPVYNTGVYLEECLNSLLNQGLKSSDYEIICINDGSTDDSQTVLDMYTRKYSNIKVFNQVNCGLSVSRNRGIDLSCGKYLFFMDSDDILEDNFLSYVIQKMTDKNLQLFLFDGKSFLDGDDASSLFIDYNREKKYGFYRSGAELLNELSKDRKFYSSVCLYIVASELIKNNIRFIEGIIHEDEAFTTEVFLRAKNVYHINYPGFQRRIRPESIMTSKKTSKNFQGYYYAFLKLNELLLNSQFRKSMGLRIRIVELYESLLNIYNELDEPELELITYELKRVKNIAKENNYYYFKCWLRHYNVFTRLVFNSVVKVRQVWADRYIRRKN
ncbi:glycosyltransferase [Facklamia sp. HMSC062C11]|uniref:glycosyltransferase n=1 Tax=Facklamia sp. HMSC062C11 TaxID=1739262 RepID=UPI001438DD63|nr:glycosyltransferase [Facklamia sp. HMSC062C11]